MPMQVLINIFIAVLWMFFQDNWGVLTFFSGYLFGLIVLFILRRNFPSKFYLITMVDIVKLFFVFIRELFASSIVVMRQILRPKLNIAPGILTIETDLEGDLEITLLSLLLCLTPGSVVVDVSPDGKALYLHAIDIPEAKESVFKSKIKFEAAIKKVTRK